jgi:hypothetical protein
MFQSPNVRVLAALGAALVASPIHATAAQNVTNNSFVLEQVRALGIMSFNFLNPPPIQIGCCGVWRLNSPVMGRMFFKSEILPSPFMQAGAVVSNGFFGRVNAILAYQIMVVGPDGDVTISLDVGGEAGGQSPGVGSFVSLTSTWSFVAPPTPTFSGVSLAGGIVVPKVFDPFYDTFHDVTDFFTVRTNQPLTLTLFADVSARGGLYNGVDAASTGWAYIDPVFSLGPGFGPEYSLVFSPGVGNSPNSPLPPPFTTPEPSTLALLATGLLAVSGLRARARRTA